MKASIFICLCLLLMSAIGADASQLLHTSVIEGLDAYATVRPVIAPGGLYYGAIGVDTVNSRIDVYDSSGTRTTRVDIPNKLRIAINRLSEDRDTLVIYAVGQAPWYGYDPYDYDVFRINMIVIAGDSVRTETVTPHCYSTYGTMDPVIDRLNIRFDYDGEYRPVDVVFQVGIRISVWESTMGVRTQEKSTCIAYTNDLSAPLSRKDVYEYLSAGFGGDDTCEGAGTFQNGYQSVNDDPWNSYTWYGTTYTINNCGVQLEDIISDSGSTDYMFSGNFVPSTANDEIIYAGRAGDILGVRQGLTDHWACYGVENDSVSEVWWIDAPSGFTPANYLSHRNGIVGFVGDTSASLFDCESGAMAQSYAIRTGLSDRSFLLTASRQVPNLFGRLGDSVFVYDVAVPTDVDDSDPDVLPVAFSLAQNYPNPFNPSTTIAYSLPERGHVTIDVFNVLGQRVRTLVDGEMPAGNHTTQWNGTDEGGHPVSSGVYLYRLGMGPYVETRKMVLLK